MTAPRSCARVEFLLPPDGTARSTQSKTLLAFRNFRVLAWF